jgi:Helix-turn-helix domain
MTQASSSTPPNAALTSAPRKIQLRPLVRPGSAGPVPTSPPKLVCTPREVADMLGVSVKALRDWRVQGLGPAVMRLTRRTLRYHVADVEAFIASRRNGTEPPNGQA